jgi:hypothetical protein
MAVQKIEVVIQKNKSNAPSALTVYSSNRRQTAAGMPAEQQGKQP